VKINHVSQVNKLNGNVFVYTLPQTTVSIDVTVKKISFKHGPYSEYAKKYLGIDTVSQQDYVHYFMDNVTINTSLTADSEQVYLVQYKNHLPWKSITQRNDGMIIAVNTQPEIKNLPQPSVVNYLNNYKTLSNQMYLELSNTSFLKERIDTSYKQVKIDTNWVRVLVTKKIMEETNFEDKAKEAADHIMDLRDRFYDLYSGDDEYLPQGEAALTIANELRREEEEFLSLFIGKSFVSSQTYHFELNPENPYQKKYTVAYFGEETGIVSDSSGENLQPLVLTLNLYDALIPYTRVLLKYQKAKHVNVFTYRTPEKAQATVSLDDKKLFQKEIGLYQFGKLQHVPVSFLKKHSFRFDNPDYIVIE
jgi:hypothetical protein